MSDYCIQHPENVILQLTDFGFGWYNKEVKLNKIFVQIKFFKRVRINLSLLFLRICTDVSVRKVERRRNETT